ncbi:hypothetical protein [Vannielia litorea]|uniref:hypothetical protein n=1 Tax=Vannielia litorea TaxID=1217970 RepID=UPI001BCE4E04|nr:hypothetical protein [Vannielia litorea]MBS8228369.1 hypothetical protein [Vannielia litorea]
MCGCSYDVAEEVLPAEAFGSVVAHVTDRNRSVVEAMAVLGVAGQKELLDALVARCELDRVE